MTQKTRQIQTGLNRCDILTVSTFNRIYTIITFGIFVVIVLKIFTRTRKTVIRRVILPGTMSGGIRKEIHDTK